MTLFGSIKYGEQLQKVRMPTAVIIKGNPKYVKGNHKAERFYSEIASLLRDKGYAVNFDKGESYAIPPKADVWIGHSRGADRLRFKPNDTVGIALGSPFLQGAINHPLDNNDGNNLFHYMLTNQMKNEILSKLTKR